MYPTSADAAIAKVPQIQIRSTAVSMFDPPALAAKKTDNARNAIEQPYW